MKRVVMVRQESLFSATAHPAEKNFRWFTPEWSCLAIIDRFFPSLCSKDLVCDAGSGKGAFLKAIPPEIPAFGVEINETLSAIAEAETGRKIICGDFRYCELPDGITRVVSNPPFSVPVIEQFLARCKTFPDLRECGFLLPAYALQTHHRVLRWLADWSLRAEIIPRRLFPRLRLPLVFVMFSRSASKELIGFSLFPEAVQFDSLRKFAKEILTNGRHAAVPGARWWKKSLRNSEVKGTFRKFITLWRPAE